MIAFSDVNLETFFHVNYSLMQYHKWSMEYIDNMIPWEKDIFVNMLLQDLEQKRLEQETGRNSR